MSYTITVHAFGLDDAAKEAMFDRIVEAAHALDEEVFCIGASGYQGSD